MIATMQRLVKRLLRPVAPAIRSAIGARRYDWLRARLIASHRFDEVSLVWRAIGRQRAGVGVMLDVGSHRGESAQPFSELGWTVHCFEPNEVNWPIIENRLTQRFPKTRLFRVAVGEKAEWGRLLYGSPESSGITSLHAFHQTHVPAASVDVITLTEHCTAEGISHVDFLKIDTEGFDYFVLRGLDWDQFRPDVVVCEFEDSKTQALGHSYDSIASYLVERGYRVIVSEWKPIARYGANHMWLRYAEFPCSLQDPRGWGNLIAFRDGAVAICLLRELEAVSPALLSSPGV